MWSSTCLACGTGSGSSSLPLCDACRRALRRAPPLVPVPAGLDSCQALLLYDGPARQLVTSLKYRNDRRALSWLVDAVAPLLRPDPDAVVTWVPTTPERRRRRGFDQAALVARGLARRWEVPSAELLERGAGRPQTGRSLAERYAGVDLAVRRRYDPVTRSVILVDDVVTTGATLRDAALAVRRAGAPKIAGLALARTPRTHPLSATEAS